MNIPRLALAVIAGIALLVIGNLAAPQDAGAQSSDTEEVVVTRYADEAPPAPTALTASSGTLSWTPGAEPGQVFCLPNCVLQITVGETTAYVIHHRATGGGAADWQRLTSVTGDPPATSYSGSQSGYEYRVQACNVGYRSLRCSDWSPTATETAASGVSTGLQ